MSHGPRPPGVSVVLTCGDRNGGWASEGWAPGGWAPGGWGSGIEAVGDEVVAVGAIPAREEVDPLLERAARLVVAGPDAALAAVLVRLWRRERLDIPVALLPTPDSEAARVWGLPSGPADLVALARDGSPRSAPLVRDDRGSVVAGVHRVGAFTGEVYCDQHLVARGPTAGVEIRPDPEGHGVTVTATGLSRWAGRRAGRVTHVHGRAVQIGCRPAPVERDGLPDRPIERRSWYPHATDWWVVA